MSMRLPCITSQLANNALDATNGENILIGNTPGEYANHIIHLLENEESRNKIAQNGYNFVRKKYNWDNSTALLKAVITGKQ